jgi:hypothetical protein
LQKTLRPEENTDACEALPSRKKLVKRIKNIAMSFAGTVPDVDKDSLHDNSDIGTKAKKYGFCVIDQSNRHNILLAVMIQGLIIMKQAAKTITKKYYTKLIFDEINLRIEDLTNTNERDPLIQVLEECKKDIQLYLFTYQKQARAAKNVLRVLVSITSFVSLSPTLISHILTQFLVAWTRACSLKKSNGASIPLGGREVERFHGADETEEEESIYSS